jgi:hypothetical protein
MFHGQNPIADIPEPARTRSRPPAGHLWSTCPSCPIAAAAGPTPWGFCARTSPANWARRFGPAPASSPGPGRTGPMWPWPPARACSSTCTWARPGPSRSTAGTTTVVFTSRSAPRPNRRRAKALGGTGPDASGLPGRAVLGLRRDAGKILMNRGIMVHGCAGLVEDGWRRFSEPGPREPQVPAQGALGACRCGGGGEGCG